MICYDINSEELDLEDFQGWESWKLEGEWLKYVDRAAEAGVMDPKDLESDEWHSVIREHCARSFRKAFDSKGDTRKGMSTLNDDMVNDFLSRLDSLPMLKWQLSTIAPHCHAGQQRKRPGSPFKGTTDQCYRTATALSPWFTLLTLYTHV
jgi:hypothetical protein